MVILVLSMDYPRPDGSHERMFVHVRNLYYKQKGIDVTVINFACSYDYQIDGIRVITLTTYKKENKQYDIVVSHASNLRNHYVFLQRYEKKFPHIVFFFHGHEVLKLNESYPKPYPYMKNHSLLMRKAQDCYDWLKLALWKRYYKELASKSHFIFVSNWIYSQFKKNIGLDNAALNHHCLIINNSIGHIFETASYDYASPKKYDFITIRSNLDGSKYGVDIVVKMADVNPQAKFLLIGKGRYFDYNKKPQNLCWIDKTLDHSQMLEYLDESRCAILMTREDTQGVMTCELAAYGMPVITSDIEVCHEFFATMPNVKMISNEGEQPVMDICRELEKGLPYPKDHTYFAENTIAKEVELFKEINSKR